ncbi:hypothetical protein PINS_up017060 [Pythium insidiosum]|nr:hypothetical protein PINS_up017060 [Pythium insidiosum]
MAPEFRRLGLARNLMDYLENVSIELYDGYFVDLFVRVSNSLAIGMYEKFWVFGLQASAWLTTLATRMAKMHST